MLPTFTGASFHLTNGLCLAELEGCATVPRVGETVYLATTVDERGEETEMRPYRVVAVDWAYPVNTTLSGFGSRQHNATITVEPLVEVPDGCPFRVAVASWVDATDPGVRHAAKRLEEDIARVWADYVAEGARKAGGQ